MKKYPRTFHFQFSKEIHDDDKVIQLHHLGNFLNDEIIVTEKLDGSNACLKYEEGVFARSHQMPTFEPWFDYLKSLYYSIRHLMNPDLWIFGENTYAIHSIEYTSMQDYFYVFNIYNTVKKEWLSWDEIVIESERLGLEVVPLVFKGRITTIAELSKLCDLELLKPSFLGGNREGFVTRVASAIPEDEFQNKVAKYVRRGHVQTDEHWKKNWKPQKLKKV